MIVFININSKRFHGSVGLACPTTSRSPSGLTVPLKPVRTFAGFFLGMDFSVQEVCLVRALMMGLSSPSLEFGLARSLWAAVRGFWPDCTRGSVEGVISAPLSVYPFIPVHSFLSSMFLRAIFLLVSCRFLARLIIGHLGGLDLLHAKWD